MFTSLRIRHSSKAEKCRRHQGYFLSYNSFDIPRCEDRGYGSGVRAHPYATLIDAGLVPLIPEMHFHAPIYLCFDRQTGKKPAVRATIDFLKEFVFDRRRMPWFADDFVCPDKGWRRILDRCLAQARDAPQQQQYAATG